MIEEFDVARLHLGPKDVLLVKMRSANISAERLEAITQKVQAFLRRAGLDNQVIVTSDAVEFEVLAE